MQIRISFKTTITKKEKSRAENKMEKKRGHSKSRPRKKENEDCYKKENKNERKKTSDYISYIFFFYNGRK